MQIMSDYITKLEGFADLEVSIIRATKINKVLKAILKLEHIPKEDEFKFKPRSQVLLDKWNKLLAVDGTPAAPAAGTANGTGAASKGAAKPNGVKGKSEAAEPAKAKEEEAKEEAKEESKEGPKQEPKKKTEEAAKSEKAPEAAEKSAAEEVRLGP